MTSILDNIESGYPIARRFRLGSRIKKRTQESLECEYEIIELELSGVTINRVCKKKELAKKVIDEIYDRYGYKGQAYIVRQSKMNFESLIDKYRK